eukprot:CAMPEP_0196692514 /NCGR_PEP_ID=MMETSP1090-20130531/27723_1 /TAXON_ID=37098 /ORGANISM="Isochrysis sp, Strain CCMP1244" /LENGTH=74 /DNA_ID=CAMNT_0042031893 /DNA_START=290 /DNA_END=509 /DNA_ORIENTATION=-
MSQTLVPAARADWNSAAVTERNSMRQFGVPAPLHPPVNPMVLDAEHLLNELNQVRSPPAAGRSVVDEEGRAPWL